MKDKLFKLRVVLAMAVLAFCASSSRAEPVQASAAAVVPVTAAQPAFNYRIKQRDTVQIRVFQEDDLSTTGRVDKDGNIAFPLLGTAKIGGLTVQEATATMQNLLREYLVHPQVAVAILEYTKEHFTILGQVTKPGTYDIPDESQVDLLEAIGMAGGYTKIANPSKILVKRVANGQQTVIQMDGKKILNLKHSGEIVPEILPGDTILVGESIF